MDLEEALAYLGVTAGDDASTVRRRYLRMLRECRPDDDPEAFMRLRTAFEIASAGAGSTVRSPHPIVVREAAGPPERPSSPFPPASQAGPSPVWADERLTPFLGRLDFVGPDALDDRKAIARQAVEALPDSPAAHWLMVRILMEAGDPAGAAQLARTCFDRNMPGFKRLLVLRWPQALTDTERAALIATADFDQILDLAQGWARTGRVEESADLVRRYLRHLETQGRGEPGQISRLLAAILLLVAADAGAEVDRLMDELSRFMLAHGGELELLETVESLTLWAFLSDLRALPPDFSPEARRAIATAVADGDPGAANAQLHELVQRSSEVATRAASQLEAYPLLAHFYHYVLCGPRSTSYSGVSTATVGGGVATLLILLFQLLRCLGEQTPPMPPHSILDELRSSPAFIQPQQNAAIASARNVVLVNCRDEPEAPICAVASEYVESVAAGSCEEAGRRLQTLREEAEGWPSGKLSPTTVSRYLEPLLDHCDEGAEGER